MNMEEFDKIKFDSLMIRCEFEEVKKDFEVFKPLLNNKMCSNIELQVGEKVFPANKMVLALSIFRFFEKNLQTAIPSHF